MAKKKEPKEKLFYKYAGEESDYLYADYEELVSEYGLEDGQYVEVYKYLGKKKVRIGKVTLE